MVSPVISIILSLLPLIQDLEPVVVGLIATIQAQTGQTQDQIFAAAGAQLSAEDAALLQDITARGGTIA
jgi:hypothetical protein